MKLDPSAWGKQGRISNFTLSLKLMTRTWPSAEMSVVP